MLDYGRNFNAQKVDIHRFTMIPKADIPRSTFRKQAQHKLTFNASNLYPVFIEEILPGDTFNVSMTAFVRLSTPIYPIMDNIDLESWFFFVPARILWTHWTNFMGEQPAGPADSISFTIPVITPPAGGFANLSIYDCFGIPPASQYAGNTGGNANINALPFRAYNMIWNEWFRDQNLQNAAGMGAANTVYDIGDGPDPYTNYAFLPVGKRHDYFTSCLPWTVKGGVAIPFLPGQATVKTQASNLFTGVQNSMQMLQASSGGAVSANFAYASGSGGAMSTSATATTGTAGVYPANLYADLSTATSNTINALRLAFQTQKLLERDARSGTRYVELILAHFGVRSPDYRQQRPEYLGGGKSPINIAPVPQTTGTGASGTTSPLGTLAGVGTGIAKNHGFRSSFTEHGYIIGLITARTDQVYQQGIRRLWTRSTRYDFYMPVFQALGEQSVYNYEIYSAGSGTDFATFGYQERWAEYRYLPSLTTMTMRSTASTPLDAWHLANKFTSLPALNATFIQEPLINILDRNLALGATARTSQEQFIADLFLDVKCARPMPLYSVPGMLDHF